MAEIVYPRNAYNALVDDLAVGPHISKYLSRYVILTPFIAPVHYLRGKGFCHQILASARVPARIPFDIFCLTVTIDL